MDASRRERIVLYGVVPIAGVLIGAVASALANKYFGSRPEADALIKVLADPRISTADRIALLKALKELDEPFWGVMRVLAGAMTFPLIWIGLEVAGWIRRKA